MKLLVDHYYKYKIDDLFCYISVLRQNDDKTIVIQKHIGKSIEICTCNKGDFQKFKLFKITQEEYQRDAFIYD